jgi:hypothetical protein
MFTENVKINIIENNYKFEKIFEFLKKIFPKSIQLKIEDENTILIKSEKYYLIN